MSSTVVSQSIEVSLSVTNMDESLRTALSDLVQRIRTFGTVPSANELPGEPNWRIFSCAIDALHDVRYRLNRTCNLAHIDAIIYNGTAQLGVHQVPQVSWGMQRRWSADVLPEQWTIVTFQLPFPVGNHTTPPQVGVHRIRVDVEGQAGQPEPRWLEVQFEFTIVEAPVNTLQPINITGARASLSSDRFGIYNRTNVKMLFPARIVVPEDSVWSEGIARMVNSYINSMHFRLHAPWIPPAFPNDVLALQYERSGSEVSGEWETVADVNFARDGRLVEAIGRFQLCVSSPSRLFQLHPELPWVRLYASAQRAFLTQDFVHCCALLGLVVELFINDVLDNFGINNSATLKNKCHSFRKIDGCALDDQRHGIFADTFTKVMIVRNNLLHKHVLVMQWKDRNSKSHPINCGEFGDAADLLYETASWMAYIWELVVAKDVREGRGLRKLGTGPSPK
jgi:hypothetical protein